MSLLIFLLCLALTKILSMERSIKETKNPSFHAQSGNEPLMSAFPHVKLLCFVSSILTMQVSDVKQRKKTNAHRAQPASEKGG